MSLVSPENQKAPVPDSTVLIVNRPARIALYRVSERMEVRP